MRQDFARAFYSSRAWAECRAAYKKSRGGLCEKCEARGLFVAGDEVHHKTKLTPWNINDPKITLNWENLELLCKQCHADEHRKPRRWGVRDDGSVTIRS